MFDVVNHKLPTISKSCFGITMKEIKARISEYKDILIKNAEEFEGHDDHSQSDGKNNDDSEAKHYFEEDTNYSKDIAPQLLNESGIGSENSQDHYDNGKNQVCRKRDLKKKRKDMENKHHEFENGFNTENHEMFIKEISKDEEALPKRKKINGRSTPLKSPNSSGKIKKKEKKLKNIKWTNDMEEELREL